MNDEDRILEQYKLYVEMADRVSARRTEANKFYISILSALLAFLAFVIGKNLCVGYEKLVMISFSILGLLLVGIWFLNVRAYRQLNTGKFKVIHELEKSLPFKCYDREWEILGRGEGKEYKTLTKLESYVPIIIGIPYMLLLIYFIFN